MKNITIYTASDCHACHLIKAYLDSKKVSFNEVDVSKNLEAMNYIVNRTGQMNVPVIKIGYKIIVGFNRSAIEELLKEK